MLQVYAPPPLTTPEDRETRIQALLAQLRPAAEQALRLMAEALVDAPDHRLLGDLEARLRDHAHDLAAAAHQTGLDGRKKGGTKVPAPPARTATVPPSSSTTCPAPS
jgi:hypothetical protein